MNRVPWMAFVSVALVSMAVGLMAGPRADAIVTMVGLAGGGPLLVMVFAHLARWTDSDFAGGLFICAAALASLVAWGGSYATFALLGAGPFTRVVIATLMVAGWVTAGIVTSPRRRVARPVRGGGKDLLAGLHEQVAGTRQRAVSPTDPWD